MKSLRRLAKLPRRLTTVFVVALLTAAASAANASAAAPRSAELPQDASQWINSRPFTLESLGKKGVVVVFFEESCPRCRQWWPQLIEASKKYADKPVVFLAVNSGQSREAVQQYVRHIQSPWPTIVDADRSLEAAWDVGNISLQNILQVRIISPEGGVSYGSLDDLESSAEKALRGARWNLDPSRVPEELKGVWRQIELGDYASAAAPLKKIRSSSSGETKKAADTLWNYVQKRMNAAFLLADRQARPRDPWAAYKSYWSVGLTYAGYDLPPELRDKVKTLAENPTVKEELAAVKEFQLLQKSLNSNVRSQQSRNATRVKAFLNKHAGTEAADKLQQMLDASGQ